MVNAFDPYKNAILDISGGNLKSVKEIDLLMTSQMEEKILRDLQTNMIMVSDLHEKDIKNITQTIFDIVANHDLLHIGKSRKWCFE